MKRIIAVVLLALVVFAGTATAGILQVGLKAGVNLANTTGDSTGMKYKVRPGLIIGAQAELGFPVSPLSVRCELLYTMKGNKSVFANVDSIRKLDEFVVAPFLVYTLPIPVVKPFFEIGPEVGFVLTHKSTSGGVSTEIKDYSKTDVSLNVGAGIKLPVGGGTGSVDVRYNLGLTDMNKSSAANARKTTTNGIQLMAGYAFTLL
jgi:hypothetical protein